MVTSSNSFLLCFSMALCTISEVHLSECPGPLVKHCIVSEFDVRAGQFLIHQLCSDFRSVIVPIRIWDRRRAWLVI